MKKIIITEQQAKNLMSKAINEQSESQKVNMAIQCFLNKTIKANLKIDGVLGQTSQKALQSFQAKKGVTMDAQWGKETYDSLTPQEIDIFKGCVSENGGIIDKVLHFIGLD